MIDRENQTARGTGRVDFDGPRREGAASSEQPERQGELLGVLYGGNLLSRNFSVVDKIRDTVYAGQMYRGKHVGTATIFQGDVRIATNVWTAEGRPAIAFELHRNRDRRPDTTQHGCGTSGRMQRHCSVNWHHLTDRKTHSA